MSYSEILSPGPEHTVKEAAYCETDGGWFVDVVSVDGVKLRYTVLGCTPYAIKSRSEAEDFVNSLIGEVVDEMCFVVGSERIP